MKNLTVKIEIEAKSGLPRRIYDLQVKPNKKAPIKIAESIIKKIATVIQIKPDLSQIKFDQVKKSILGKHVLYQQLFYGKPVSGAWIRVDMDNDGKVFNIMNDLIPGAMLNQSKASGIPKISAEKAKGLAREKVKSSDDSVADFGEPELVCFLDNGIPVLAWKVLLIVRRPAREWKIYLDAGTGEILQKINLLKYINGQGKVFDPTPVATLNDFTLKDNSPIPAEAYSVIILKDLENSGLLDGPFVSTRITINRAMKPDFKFLFDRADRHFKEVMAYYHIDSVQRYIQQLGFNNVMNKPIAVNIDGKEEDNSFYSPLEKSITFGKGGVDDAEDAEIIIHEYGHAIIDDLVPGFGEIGDEAKAMGEGFGDYLAASFFAFKKPPPLQATFGNWNAAAFLNGNMPPFMRRLDEPKIYPRDYTGSSHDDCEIWSACLWKIRTALGEKIADKLIIAHLRLLKKDSTFEAAANYLIEADQQLNMGANATIIKNIFIGRGILI